MTVIHLLPDPPRRWVVLVCPSFGVSTAEAYRWFDECRRSPASARAGGTTATLRTPPRGDLASAVVNDLEPCVARRFPVVADIAERLRESGAAAAAMSGSGSAVFGLFEQGDRARRAAERLAGPAWTVRVLRTLTRAETLACLRPASRA